MREAPPIATLSAPHRWRDVPIEECGEPLVPLSGYSKLHLIPQYSLQGLPGSSPELWVRQGVADRLLAVAAALEPHRLQLAIFDGWRSSHLQQTLFDRFREHLRQRHPALHAEALDAETVRYVSEPSSDPTCPSPHLTGGAVDLTLCHDTGIPLPMGTAFDAFEPAASTRFLEDNIHADPEARRNRRLLFAAMTGQGFTSYPEEWWHFDYGNQFWGAISGNPACYGAALVPDVPTAPAPIAPA